ncbi:uncharacterized protein LOC119402653 [Rhipicephalus sanguineus]|uniref:uncharacterized protein LOC119402653 n=1 Tax=Rhipicephalus sanguineus TaxID=34632 RepID=UPI0020C4DC26|nr:uncharacterized protein LOC119402653 [Rhipicephalus sanguineus]
MQRYTAHCNEQKKLEGMVLLKIFVMLLALTNINKAFRLPNQDEITNAIGTAMVRQAGADLTRKLMQKFSGNFGGNYAAPAAGSGGNGLLNAVLQGVANGLTASSRGSLAGLPGSGGLVNTLTQGFGAPTPGAPGLLNALAQGLGGNSVAPPTPDGQDRMVRIRRERPPTRTMDER